MNTQANGFFGMFNIISGGAFSNLSIFAMSITPYINASIIIQLLTVAIPALEKMSKEGNEGRKKLAQFTRYGTIVLALIQAIGIAVSFKTVLYAQDFMTYTMVVLSLTAGTAFIMWLGEQMTEYGIGNGTSLIIFAGIISRLPDGMVSLWTNVTTTGVNLMNILGLVAIIVVMLLLIAAVVWVQKAERRIPVQYAKRVVGRKMYGGQSTHIPVAVSMAGVMPIILAMSLLMFPAMIISTVTAGQPSGIAKAIYEVCTGAGAGWTIVVYCLIYTLLIVGFSFFYTLIVFNPVEVANNLKKNGGFIPGIRAGKPTADYLSGILNKITLFGAIFIAFIAIFPVVVQSVTGVRLGFGGTALLIVVGVALETVKQLEAQLVMKHYKGFLD
jgi:preprotein translocase subunit SecY